MLVSGVIFAPAAPAFQAGDGGAPLPVTGLRNNPANMVARRRRGQFTGWRCEFDIGVSGGVVARTGVSAGDVVEHIRRSEPANSRGGIPRHVSPGVSKA